MSGSGTLYFIATPIGNLSDITYRAVETLRSVEVLACEDTRRTGRLLKHLGIHVSRLIVANSHNEASASAEIIELLKQGIDVGLVTDAGMPGISDPGERVASAVIESGEKFTVIPGSSAPVSALVVSGLSTGRYVMEGFLPRKGRERSDRLDRIAMEESTSIMLESPKRIGITLDELAKVCGKSRKAVVVRELTKLHEEITRGSLEELIEKFKNVQHGNVLLGRHSVVGAGAVILPNVIIETGAAVAALSLVTRSVKEFTIVSGISARRVGKRKRNLLKLEKLFRQEILNGQGEY